MLRKLARIVLLLLAGLAGIGACIWTYEWLSRQRSLARQAAAIAADRQAQRETAPPAATVPTLPPPDATTTMPERTITVC